MVVELDIMKRNMIDCQFRPAGISNVRLIEAFLSVPRDLFVPGDNKLISYFDGHIEIKKGRWLLSSLSIAKLINTVDVSRDDIILEIGTATGYATAVLAHLTSLVIVVEQDLELLKMTEKNLSHISCDNTLIVKKNHISGYEKSAPYDKIFIFGSVSSVHDNLLSQLSDNGSLITVVNDNKGTFGKAVVYKKNKNIINVSDMYEVSLPEMVGFEKKEGFNFS